MTEDVLEMLSMNLPEIFGEGGRKGEGERVAGERGGRRGSFELLSFCVKEDIGRFHNFHRPRRSLGTVDV
jgi:hypothetical protein